MALKKGNIPWNKGKRGIHSDETKNNIFRSFLKDGMSVILLDVFCWYYADNYNHYYGMFDGS